MAFLQVEVNNSSDGRLLSYHCPELSFLWMRPNAVLNNWS